MITPAAFAAFSGLGSCPYILDDVVANDKLHAITLGIIRLCCDMTKDYLKRKSNVPLTKLITLVNERLDGIPPGAQLPSRRPFLASKDCAQAGVSAKMRRQTAPFLWCCLMGVTDTAPNEDLLLQCGLVLDVANNFLCNNKYYTDPSLQRWQRYLFESGHMMATRFEIYVSTKFHRTMRHVAGHIQTTCCLFRASSEENEWNHWKYNFAYASTNVHIYSLSVHPLQSSTDHIGQHLHIFPDSTDAEDSAAQ